MDTREQGVALNPPSISTAELAAHFGSAQSPLLFDVRREAAYAASDVIIAGASRDGVEQIVRGRDALPPTRPVVVYCVHGHEVSQGAAQALRAAGIDAVYLDGGIEAWRAQGGATSAKSSALGVPASLVRRSQWITRERPKIDRIACPWLIRRFIDPRAQFHYVAATEVIEQATARSATPYDVPGVQFTHRGDLCSFDAFIADFGLRDASLTRLADIVRAADTGYPERSPQAHGLLAVSLGLSVLHHDDHQMLEIGLQVYDALYAWARSASGETHNAALFEAAAAAASRS